MSVTTPNIPLSTGTRAVTIVVQTSTNGTGPTFLSTGDPQLAYNRLVGFFRRMRAGVWNTNILEITNSVYATGTATCASVIATNTLVIGGVTLTAVNSAPSSVQFVRSTTDSVTAANIVTTINALTTLNKVVQATSSGAVVTIASLVPGTIGNLITLSSAGGTITVGSALTGGTDGTKYFASHGL